MKKTILILIILLTLITACNTPTIEKKDIQCFETKVNGTLFWDNRETPNTNFTKGEVYCFLEKRYETK